LLRWWTHNCFASGLQCLTFLLSPLLVDGYYFITGLSTSLLFSFSPPPPQKLDHVSILNTFSNI
jgi:hypothetical protein